MMKILLVDDSLAIAGLYQQMLEAHGYEVVTANSGAEALEVAIEHVPDIGLVDFHLPDFTGEELTRRLLAHPVTKHMVISMLSAYSDVTRKSLDAGAVDMITKETPEELFLLRVEALVRNVQLKRESASHGHALPVEDVIEELPFKVLLVDDSRFVRSAYQAMLEEIGCTVLIAENMQDALALARAEKPDLAIVDFYMKGGNGDELTRSLLNDPQTQSVLVVVMTSQMEVKEVALAAGALEVIHKGEQQGVFIQRVASIREYRRQIGRQIHRHMVSAEEARHRYQWVESILQSMRDPVIVVDRDGGVLHVNAAAELLLELSAEEVRGQCISALCVQENGVAQEDEIIGLLQAGKVISTDRILYCQGERTITVHISGGVIAHTSATGTEIEGAVLVLYDLSERLQEEKRQQYLAFQSGIAEMSASILHHIGNTLVGIGGKVVAIEQKVAGLRRLQAMMSEVGSSADVGEDKLREVLDAGARALQRLTGEEGIEGVLQQIDDNIQRIDSTISVHRSASRSDLSSSRFALGSMVEDALQLLAEPIRRAGIELQTELAGGVETEVEMPRNPAIQMVLSLLQNSIEALERRKLGEEKGWQGQIRVLIRQQADEGLMLQIEDNGYGIEESQQPHLFTPGYSTKLDGSGFGLHSAGGFLQGIGGELALLSEGRNCGVVAKIIFPLAE